MKRVILILLPMVLMLPYQRLFAADSGVEALNKALRAAVTTEGIVINPTGNNLRVRTAPPKSTAFSYELGKDTLCSIGVGTTFYSFQSINLYNGEVWFRIKTKKIHHGSEGCNNDNASVEGWIVGRLSRGWTIRLDDHKLTTEEKQQFAESPPVKGAVEQDDNPNYWSVYCCVVLGTLLCIIFIDLFKRFNSHRKTGEITINKLVSWFSGKILIMTAFISLITTYLVSIRMTLQYADAIKINEIKYFDEIIDAVRRPFGVSALGYIPVGFVLAYLVLKVITSSEILKWVKGEAEREAEEAEAEP